MKILIREKSRKRYLGPRNTWVKSTNAARVFKSGGAAVAYGTKSALDNIEIVHAFPNESYNFSVPVDAFKPRKRRRKGST